MQKTIMLALLLACGAAQASEWAAIGKCTDGKAARPPWRACARARRFASRQQQHGKHDQQSHEMHRSRRR